MLTFEMAKEKWEQKVAEASDKEKDERRRLCIIGEMIAWEEVMQYLCDHEYAGVIQAYTGRQWNQCKKCHHQKYDYDNL